jgi:23S rRNA (cytidine1920-2'-O)/16S rRNA (cytidine1409-2'-O)-methyltransferase
VPKHLRLDAELVRRGLVGSRTEAKLAIEEGVVHVNGVASTRPATLVAPGTPVTLVRDARRFVSRGGDKLDGALDRLGVAVEGRRWLDAGASTGGFTDCLLQRGATAVLAVDVGYGQLDWRLRNDERVTVMERTNVRELTVDDLPWIPDGLVADLSFISLRTVMPALVHALAGEGDAVVMVKPQFEVGKDNVGKGGVVRDQNLWTSAIEGVVQTATEHGLHLAGATASDVPGPSGNREFFLWLRSEGLEDVAGAIATAVAEASGG